MALDLETGESPPLGQGAENVVLLLVPPHDGPDPPEPEMPAQTQEDHVLQLGLPLVVDVISELPRELGVCEEAAPAGAGVVVDPELLCEFELGDSPATLDCVEGVPVDDPLLLYLCLPHELGRQGSQDFSLEPGLGLYERHGVPPLAEGALAQDLSGHVEFCPDLVPQLLGLHEHVDPAVDADVHLAPVSVGGIRHQVQEFLSHEEVVHGDIELLAHLVHGALVAVAERRREVDRLDLDSLVHHRLDCEGAVETARE